MNLIELTTTDAIKDEGVRMQSALQDQRYIDIVLTPRGIRVFSMRDDHVSYLSLGVVGDVVIHIVGPHNCLPTERDMESLEPLVAAAGLTLDHTAPTVRKL